MPQSWEDLIALNPASDRIGSTVGFAMDHRTERVANRFKALNFISAVEKDDRLLPCSEAREGYYGDLHFNYWLSGLMDSCTLINLYRERTQVLPHRYLDFGGASGRVARHMAIQHCVPEVYLADINREHVNFNNQYLSGLVRSFQCTSIPHLPFADEYFDLVSAFSVFSHIESFDDTWLLELKRILRPGGLIILTANIDTFQDVTNDWPVYRRLVGHVDFDQSQLGKPLTDDRLVVRWNSNGSYSSIVFLKSEYIERRWKPFFDSIEVVPYLTQFQSGVICRVR